MADSTSANTPGSSRATGRPEPGAAPGIGAVHLPAPDETGARAALPYGFFFVRSKRPRCGSSSRAATPLPIWTGVQYVPGEWPEAAKSPPTVRVVKTASGHSSSSTTRGSEADRDQRRAERARRQPRQERDPIKDGVARHKMAIGPLESAAKDGREPGHGEGAHGHGEEGDRDGRAGPATAARAWSARSIAGGGRGPGPAGRDRQGIGNLGAPW